MNQTLPIVSSDQDHSFFALRLPGFEQGFMIFPIRIGDVVV